MCAEVKRYGWKESGSLNGAKQLSARAQAHRKTGHWRQNTGQLWNKVGTPILMIQDEKN